MGTRPLVLMILTTIFLNLIGIPSKENLIGIFNHFLIVGALMIVSLNLLLLNFEGSWAKYTS